jgi:membrane-bound lytic murein transglycosylase D
VIVTMMKRNILLLTAALLATACATTAPPPAPLPNPQISANYRKDLEEAYSHIVAREEKPVPSPRVDVEAAASMPIPQHRTIAGAVSYFSTDLKPSIQTSLTRSAKYKPLIDRVLDEYQLPKGLAYLPVIESAYSPTLTSRAGAHGIWQFMSETARDYGLRVDWWIDERADPERSTRAAAAYLRDLYKQFNDWPLTLAAYNCGPGRVHRALNDATATSFWQLLEASALPKETRGYVPTFYATLIIASDPTTYGFRLAEPIATSDDDTKHVEVEGPLSLQYLAEVTSVDEARLRELNPTLRRAIVPPGRAVVRVPAQAAETVAARATTMKLDDANIAICSYTLRERDSIRNLARLLGTTPESLVAMNNLRSAESAGEGDSIYLPVRARELGTLLSQSEMYYAVRKGDTLYSIAKAHKLTIDELLDLNDLRREHKLHAGEKLRVSTPRALTAGGM